ncbi:T9SS type A sorting domain-containing protein [Maribacter algarum]|uniref:T9SS type A sorting domain-containing protein n=1 Tax=Maribacter algarum (ex Zhang et al. 2020) TaxID=2578118 RepID=A0A5S3PRL1_9FLAO|nr:T9SS type A sorting domain-containing protein [Maribacter algarum]TMM57386.1 T9SS type A sorting domain-containing protein [Maribacter algarum]
MEKKLLLINDANKSPQRIYWPLFALICMALFLGQSVHANDALFTIDGGTITGGPFEFCVGDGQADHVSGIQLECNNTENSQWVVTDLDGKILGLPPNPEAVNFDGAGAGVCLIWHLSYAAGLEGLDAGNNVSALKGEFDFSNEIRVYRNQPDGGTLVGGPYNFVVDGTPDMVSGISLTGKRSGKNSTWVITDDQGKILGIPPSLEAVEGVNFDGAGAGTCFIYHLRYEDGLTGLEAEANLGNLEGCFDLSNGVEVIRSEGVMVEAGEIVGGPFEFCVDGSPDMVSGLSLTGDRVGTNSSWVITDDQGKILGLPPTLEAVEGVDFDGAGAGTCLIWYLRYEDGLEGAEMGMNAHDLKGTFDLSNPVEVVRRETEGGTLVGGPFYFTVDGTPDMVSGIELTGRRAGTNSIWVITDEDRNILGTPPSLAAVEGVDFDGAGAGTCFIYHLRYEDGLTGLEAEGNLGNLEGCFDLSNRVEVNRLSAPQAGEIVGGPFEFCVDGTPDMVSGLSLTGDRAGSMRSWVITDDQGKILGLPPTLEAVEGVNFDGAGAGTCLIWYLRYEEGLEGLAPEMNAHDLKGTFDLSNPVEVVRRETEGGTLVGGPFYFTVDGTPDMVSGIELTGRRAGSNSIWVITDEDRNILGTPPSLAAVEGVDFDGAGAGTCFIYHLRYEDGLTGLEAEGNLGNLEGCFDLSNRVEVNRLAAPEAGEIVGGPFEFCVDGTPDMVSGLSLTGNRVGTNSSWVITDDQGKILGLPPTLDAVEGVNFDGAGAGTCLIWYLRYEDGLEGAEMGMNAHDLKGTFDLSNPVEVVRRETEGGTLVGGPFYFTVDGTPDMVSGIELTGRRAGTNSIWVITDEDRNILGTPPSLAAVEGVDFDGAGAGTCFIYHLRYEDGLTGLEAEGNLGNLEGCFDLSNRVEVIRSEEVMVEAGEIVGGPFEFCVDGTPDMVSGLSLTGDRVGSMSSWVITDDQGKILGLPPTLEAVEGVDFDGAGAGTCLIWYLRYEEGLKGLAPDLNANDLKGNFDLSNPVSVVRIVTEGGTLVGGPFEFVVDDEVDNVSGIELTGERSGTNSTFVITDDQGKILGLPPTMEAVEGVDFNAAGVGTCLIWYLRYEDGLVGLEPDLNANDLQGCFDLSNAIEVVRLEETSVGGKSSATVFPLPASDILNVSLKSFGNSDVQVNMVDLAGNSVKRDIQKVVQKGISLDIQSVPSGLYILNISNGEGKFVSKKVIIR